jgi:hypothetical protein
MPIFLHFFSFIQYITEHENMVGSHHRLADVLSVFSGFLGSHHIAVTRHVQVGVLARNWWSLRLQSVAEIFGLPPTCNPHIRGSSRGYLNGSQRFLDI